MCIRDRRGGLMADRPSGTRAPVPIVLGSASSGTEEGRAFFQARLALFGGWVALISGAFYAAYWVLVAWISPNIERLGVPVGDPTLYHLGATIVAGVLWAVARWSGRLPVRALEWLEAIASLLMCACFALMGIGFAQGHLTIGQDAMHGIFAGLSACSYVL